MLRLPKLGTNLLVQRLRDADDIARRIQIARAYIAFRALFDDVAIFVAVATRTVEFREIDLLERVVGREGFILGVDGQLVQLARTVFREFDRRARVSFRRRQFASHRAKIGDHRGVA
jgi:hypothetical protein